MAEINKSALKKKTFFLFPGKRVIRNKSWKRPDKLTVVFTILGFLILLFIAIPLINTIFKSNLGLLWDTLNDAQFSYSILLTIYSGFIATFIGLILGVPIAYLLARHNFYGKRIIEGLIDIPVVVPHSAAGIALLFVFGSNYFLGKLFKSIGIEFVDAVPGVVVAMMFVSVPFLINSAKEGFKSVDPSPWRTFRKVSLPLAWKSILSGSVMMWARGISEFGAVMIIAYHVPFLGNYPSVTPVLVSERFESYGIKYAQPVAVISILICLVAFIFLRSITGKDRKN
ncbi:MAG: ABC transporter permease [Chloroflexi bacterium]|nr:ABC transporter permease [Chloroflexota bacterium]